MTINELVESVCISLNDYLQTTKDRVRRLIPQSANFVLFKYQWEFGIGTKEDLTTIANQQWVNFPDNCYKEISLFRADYTKRITYITPQEYDDKLAADSTPYGIEVVKYTVKGGDDLKRKRFYFLDVPTSVMTINLTFSKRIDPLGIQALPDEFIEVIKSHVIYKMTPPMVNNEPNPSFVIVERDFRTNLSDLISMQSGQRGRLTVARLDDIQKNTNRYLHK